MRTGLVIDVRPQIIPAIQQTENRRRRINQRRQRMPGRKTAAIVGIVGQQRRAISKHGREVRVIRVNRKIVGRLFRVTQILAVPSARLEARIARHWIGQFHPFIQRTDKNRLPTTTGQAGHGNAILISIRMRQQYIEPFAHVQVKGRNARHPAEIQLRHLIMPHAIGELPHANPLHIERDHAALGLVDAA